MRIVDQAMVVPPADTFVDVISTAFVPSVIFNLLFNVVVLGIDTPY